MYKSSKAITLITLIITIIVLLVFAVVTMNLVLGDNGLINKAKTSKALYENERNKEDGMANYIEIYNGEIKSVSSSREETWNGATMLTINISNITGGTFKINVNNVEANNYGNLYYYVNNKLVYSGTDTSFVVTELDGQPITDNTHYKIKVLSEPFEIGITTGEGDNVDAWLACIGNSNVEGYTLDNLNELFSNTTLMGDLIGSSNAVDYLLKSTEIILPELIADTSQMDNYTIASNICSNSRVFSKVANNSSAMTKICNLSSWRNAMYDNYTVTESILANSNVAKNCMKNSSRYQVVAKTMTLNFQTFYDGKAFVLGSSQAWDHDSRCWITHGNYINGSQTLSYNFADGYGTNGLVVPVNKFASTVIYKQSYDNSHTGYMAIFKI